MKTLQTAVIALQNELNDQLKRYVCIHVHIYIYNTFVYKYLQGAGIRDL
jgi:hypothetical protein